MAPRKPAFLPWGQQPSAIDVAEPSSGVEPQLTGESSTMTDPNVAPTTEDNLRTAFAGESQANRMYLAFAQKAEQEGLPQIAKLFKAAAEAETIHALAHLRNAGMVGSTVDNLRHAVEGETYECTTMYPPMTAQAEREGHKARVMFGYAEKAEKVEKADKKKAAKLKAKEKKAAAKLKADEKKEAAEKKAEEKK